MGRRFFAAEEQCRQWIADLHVEGRMAGHEARINDALKQLGEEFRLGMVQAEEYRSRRRLLLESWGERDATTSPGSLRSKTATAPNRGTVKAAAPEKAKSVVPLVIVVAVVVLAAAGYFALRPRPGPAAASMPAAEPLSPQVMAVRKAADDFLAGNAWDEAGINTFLQAWRPLSADERAKAMEQPSLRTLRHKLDQNIQAESELVSPDAKPEERQRLTLLENFARELAGEAQ